MENTKPGFTLIEVIVASSICAIIAVAMISAFMVLDKQSKIVAENNVAVLELSKVVEDVLQVPFEETTTTYPNSIEVAIANPTLEDQSVVIYYDDPEGDPLYITAQITWTSGVTGQLNQQRELYIVKTK